MKDNLEIHENVKMIWCYILSYDMIKKILAAILNYTEKEIIIVWQRSNEIKQSI